MREDAAQRRRAVLRVLAPPRAFALIPLTKSGVTLGRSAGSTVTIEDDALSREHARIFWSDRRYHIEDLGSTNGTFVDGVRIERPTPLEDGCRIQLGQGTILRFTLQDDDEYEANRRMYEASVLDGLTGVYNRLFFDERLKAEFSYAQRHGTALSVLFIDIDRFKQTNDTYGHAAGDEILRHVAALMAQTVRLEDILARYGGEEFVVLARGTSAHGAVQLAERLRARIEATPTELPDCTVAATVSIGVATLAVPGDFDSPDRLLASADGALYAAKEQGRNRVQRA